jgi:hypothetical protein
MSDITYETYLEVINLGLNPLPANSAAAEIYKGIPCKTCPLQSTYTCLSNYFVAAANYYPILLTQNPELAL